MRCVVLACAALLVVGCSEAPRAATSRELPKGVAARVGASEIATASIARVAGAQGLTPAVARDILVRDAIFAEGARRRGLDVGAQGDAVLARRLLHALRAEADAQGELTDAELDGETKRRWLELDRPAAVRVVHAVVIVKPDASDAEKKAAERVASAIRDSVTRVPVTPQGSPTTFGPKAPAVDDATEKSFLAAAEATPHAGLKVVAEPLPPVAQDARWVTTDGGGVDEAFTREAWKLTTRGEVSPVVWSSFGAHVIMLLERTPEQRVSIAERRRRVRPAVIRARARDLERALLEKVRAKSSIERSADAALAELKVSP